MIFKNFFKSGAKTIARKHHSISRKDISENALKVLYRLNASGFKAYIVGGGVRDLLLKRKPKDYDVATDAHPDQIRDVFRNSRVIGRRFKLVHVFFPDEIIEVSTFRANVVEKFDKHLDLEDQDEAPIMLQADNTYGTMEEDAWRRDFTVNALYYGIEDFALTDYTGGMQDLKKKSIRMIGDPLQRYHEDPVRLLRAIRLAAKLNFNIEAKTKGPLLKLAHLLQHVPKARLFDELLKLFFEGYSLAVYEKLKAYGYFKALFPHLDSLLNEKRWKKLIDLALKASDARFAEGKSLNPAFLLAIFLWPLVQKLLNDQKHSKVPFFHRLNNAMAQALSLQCETMMIPRRFTATMQAIWLAQYHLERRRKSRIIRIMEQRYFRAAFDFLMLRADAGEPLREVANWWQKIQSMNSSQQDKMIKDLVN